MARPAQAKKPAQIRTGGRRKGKKFIIGVPEIDDDADVEDDDDDDDDAGYDGEGDDEDDDDAEDD